MSPSESKRDAVEAAAHPLRERQRAESSQLAAAERSLRRADRDHDRALRKPRWRPLAGRRGDSEASAYDGEQTDGFDPRDRAIDETRALLADLGDFVEEDEAILDMAAAVNAGHDGILVVSDRRLCFIAPRRTLSLGHREIDSVEVKGRRLGSRITVSRGDDETTFSGLRQSHARELVALVEGQTAAAE